MRLTLGWYSQQNATRLIILLLILHILQHLLNLILVFLFIGVFQGLPVGLIIGSLVVFGAFTVWTDHIASLELEQESFLVVVENLFENILPLNTFNQLHDVQIIGQFLFTLSQESLLLLCLLKALRTEFIDAFLETENFA